MNRRDFGVAAACAVLFAPICKAAEFVKGAFGRDTSVCSKCGGSGWEVKELTFQTIGLPCQKCRPGQGGIDTTKYPRWSNKVGTYDPEEQKEDLRRALAFHPWQPPHDPRIARALYNRRAEVQRDLNERYAAALEEELWGTPDERPMGIPHWVVPNRST